MKKIYLAFVGSLLGLTTVKAQLYAPEIKVMQIIDNNVGINEDNPQSKLHIKSGGSNVIRFERAGSNVFGFEIGGTTFGFFNYTRNKYLWLASGNNIGIGSDNPQSKLHIKSEGSNVIRFERDDCNTFGFEIGGTELGLVNYSNNDQYMWRALGSNLLLVENVGSVGIGRTPGANYKLDVAGTLRADNYIGKVNGADFVFEKDYKLKSLSETERFINENKHLPEIASAKEMEENGVNIAQFQMKLLQKMEEMTLYIIDQNKKNEKQEQELKILKAKIKKLESLR